MEEALIAQLLAGAGLTTLVDDRITWDQLDENGVLPAIVLQLIDGPPDYTLKGRTRFGAHLGQADCWGASGKQAADVGRAFIAALDLLAWPFTQPGLVVRRRRDWFLIPAPNAAGATKRFRTSLDFRVWFSET